MTAAPALAKREMSAIPTACTQMESTVLPAPIHLVWAKFKGFKFQLVAPNHVASTKWTQGGPGRLDSVVRVSYKDGSVWDCRITELSERNYTLAYEVISAEPEMTASSVVGELSFARITDGDQTFLRWTTDFSNDADATVMQDQKYKKLEIFADVKANMESEAKSAAAATGVRAEAPYLAAYFDAMMKMTNDVMDMTMPGGNPLELMAVAFDTEKRGELEAMQAEANTTLQNLVRDSFKKHDRANTGTLDAAESATFFQHYVALFLDFSYRMGENMQQKQLAMSVMMLTQMMGMPAEMAKAQTAEAQEEMDTEMAKLQQGMVESRRNYEANKEELNAKAFAVLDVNKDGKLQEQEVVDALTPDTPKYEEMHAALGLAERAKEMAQRANSGLSEPMTFGPEGEGQQECVQQ